MGARLAVGGKPMAGDRPFAGGYGAGYSPVAADSGKPFKGDSAPAQQAIVIQGVPAADDEVYGDSSIVTDGGFMPAAFKGDGSYYGDHDGIVFADDHKDLGDFDSARLAVGGKPMAGDRPFAGGYGAGYSPVAADSGKPFKGDSAPAQQAIIVGGAPALSDAFYADEQVLSDGNKFDVPFFDNAGYVTNDQGVIFDSNYKDKGHDHAVRLAVGGKPMAGDSPFAGGYGAGYSPVATGTGIQSKPLNNNAYTFIPTAKKSDSSLLLSN